MGSYISSRGEAFTEQMTAQRYLTLSRAIDRHFEDPTRISTTTLLIGASSDQIVPMRDLETLNQNLSGASRLVKLTSDYGHDAYLKESAAISAHIATFLSNGQNR